jgi:peptide/nickel transport system substrate-binding protein
MYRSRRFLTAAVAALSSAVLLLSACSSANSETTGDAADGEPVSGGVVRAIQMGEPRSLDPAALSNTWAHHPVLGNALYGTLMIDNPDTLEIEYRIATDFSTDDGGRTFTLELQPDLLFTDGTPYDAAAVKFNWDRLRDPALGSTTLRQALQIAGTEVVGPTTLKVTLVEPNPHFPASLVASGLNWIASPTALQKGQAAFDENPVGAGPFTLVRWTRQDAIELERNPDYWDSPKPYLDGLTITTVVDSNQRLNTMVTGGAQLSTETNWNNLNKAEAAGLGYEVVPTGGGQMLGMNMRRAPFDDIRARRAVALATDIEALNSIVYNGEGKVPRTLFPEDSPFFADIPLHTTDKEAAQALFDELAAEGKPVEFTYLSYPTTEAKLAGEALQAQLSAFDNVTMNVEVVDYGTAGARSGARDFDMIVTSSVIQDPDFPLWMAFHSDSQNSYVGMDDEQLSTALDAARVAESQEERKAAYVTVQERIAELVPGIWYTDAVPSVVVGEDVHGVTLYTLASTLPEELWRAN